MDVTATKCAAAAEATRRLTALMLAPDRAELEALIDPACLWGHSDGRLQPRDEMIDGLVARTSVFEQITTGETAASDFGDVVVIDQSFAAEAVSKGRRVSPRLRIALVWRRTGDVWRLAARRAAPAPATA